MTAGLVFFVVEGPKSTKLPKAHVGIMFSGIYYWGCLLPSFGRKMAKANVYVVKYM